MSQHAPLPATVAELQALVLEQQASLANMVREIAVRVEREAYADNLAHGELVASQPHAFRHSAERQGA